MKPVQTWSTKTLTFSCLSETACSCLIETALLRLPVVALLLFLDMNCLISLFLSVHYFSRFLSLSFSVSTGTRQIVREMGGEGSERNGR